MYRSVDTAIWDDPWFQEELGRDEKLLFLCLFTNQRTTTVGVYQVTPATLALETGIPAAEIPAVLASLEPKVVWWPEHRIVWVRNFFRRQFQKPNAKVIAKVGATLFELPQEVRDAVCQEYPSFADIRMAPRKARDGRLPISIWRRVRAAVFERDDFTCCYCGRRGLRLECDHVIPISRGGSNELGNLATACVPCNRAKSDKLLEEWHR